MRWQHRSVLSSRCPPSLRRSPQHAQHHIPGIASPASHPRPAACGCVGCAGWDEFVLCQAVLGCRSAEWNLNDLETKRLSALMGTQRCPSTARGWEQSVEQPWLPRAVPTSSFASPPPLSPALPNFGGVEGGRGRVSPCSAVAVATAVSLAAEHTSLAASPSVSC